MATEQRKESAKVSVFEVLGQLLARLTPVGSSTWTVAEPHPAELDMAQASLALQSSYIATAIRHLPTPGWLVHLHQGFSPHTHTTTLRLCALHGCESRSYTSYTLESGHSGN
jgi:hypothetical protein